MFGTHRRQLGWSGERIAEKYLRKLGLRVVARNFNAPAGEVDLVMRDGQTLVFVEVKTRRHDCLADPEESVGPGKRRRMARAAQWFLARQRSPDAVYRFDIVAVLRAADGSSQVRHIPDAFVI